MAVQNKNLEVSPGVQGVWIDVKDYFALGLGAIDEQSYIEDADAAAVAAGLWLFFSPGTYRISDDMTLSAHCWFAEGAMLSIDAGKTVTFDADSKLTADLYQIFSGSGTAVFYTGCLVERMYPQWWGATGDGITDDTAAIQSSIVAANDYNNAVILFFPRGRYLISSPLLLDRRITIEGTGFGSQIYQESDDHLFTIAPYAGPACKGLTMSSLHLGSAATTAGKALIHCFTGGSMWFENLNLAGGAYGIWLEGSLFNTFRNINSDNAGFFGAVTSCDIWVYVSVYSGTVHSNGNRFIDMYLDNGNYGFYIAESGFEGGNHIIGCKIEQGAVYGIYCEGAGGFSLTDIHMEGTSVDLGVRLVGCQNARLEGKVYKNIRIERSHRINIINGGYSSLTVDKFSSGISVDNAVVGAGVHSIDGSHNRTSGLTFSSNEYLRPAGLTTASGNNLVDGDLEVWAGGAPLGFRALGTGNLIAEETGIVKFGSKSAKIQVGAAHTSAYLRYDLDIDKYLKTGLTNYRSSAYKWTASGSGTGEFYVELAAGGDPRVDNEPEIVVGGSAGGVLINDVWGTPGAMGSLAVGEWDYGDNDSLGYNTIYVRITADADPDGEAAGYVQARHRLYAITVSCWVYKPQTNGANCPLWLYSGPPGSGTAGGAPSIPFDEWTRIGYTFLPASGKTYGLILIGWWTGGSANNTCYVDGIEIVDGHIMSPVFDDSRGIDGDFRVGGRTLGSAFAAFTANDATPSVAAGNNFVTANGVGTTVTMFDGGAEGQEILVKIADGNTTLDFTGSNLKGNGGVDWSPASGDHLRCTFDGTDWWCDIGDNTP